ncbi:MAG TPA: hypothetical protein DF712_02670 [Balneola sp.]|nr:hypothetical protein [Balneola sp.]
MDQYFSTHHVSLFFVASALSYGGIQIIKPFIKRFCDDKKDVIIRLASIIIGGIIGYSLSKQILDIWIGSAAGVFNAATVGFINAKIKSKHGRDDKV